VAVTGATGFIGRALVARLANIQGLQVLALSRTLTANPVPGVIYIQTVNLTEINYWQAGLDDVDIVVHAAARAHVLDDRAIDPLAEFRLVNVTGTKRLAEQAAAMGVKRFVFLSSIGVNGLQTSPNNPFSEHSKPNPHNAYALSKWEAEQSLLSVAHQTGMEVVMIRPPLVHGLNAPGNFGTLMRAVQRGVPLPLAAVHNLRSLVGLDNLVDFIMTCARHPAAANQTFLVSDGADVSTPDLIRAMAQAVGRPARLFPVPTGMLVLLASLIGKRAAMDRLCGNLQLDISKARELLQWSPPHTLQQGLTSVVAGAVEC